MARRRRRTKKDPLNYIALPKLNLDPDTKKSIFVVLILAFGAISLLSLFDLAGSMGVYLSQGILLLFGWGRWVFPIILLALGFFLYNEDSYKISGANYLGLFLFVLSFHALLHLFIEQDQWREIVNTGAGGGYMGLFLASVFIKIMGFWASLIVLICLLLISLMLMFNTSLAALIGKESWLAKLLYPVNFIFSKVFSREKHEEYDEDEYDLISSTQNEDGEDEDEDLKNKEEDEDKEEVGFHSRKIKTSSIPVKEEEKTWMPTHINIDLPLNLLNGKTSKPTSGDIKANSSIIRKTLENFGIHVEMSEVSVGPTVTQYTLKPSEGIKLSRITALNNDLSLALAAHPIRIEAPIPGKALVGIEMPNQTVAIVSLKEILSSREFKARKNNLTIALGKDVAGKPWIANLGKMPHLLVAGATGSGKSVMLNSIIVSLLYQNNPDDLRLVMVDPKRVELPVYNNIPHLLTPVITDVNKTINALKWCLNEMDQRFEVLSKYGKRDIISFNKMVNSRGQGGIGRMPYIVFIIDELADLMVVAAREVEAAIIRLAQMARAVGIHLILSTQRPSVDVITGLIKANITSRIAFAVASSIDSRTILDVRGAEKLLGRGDMLFSSADLSKPKRLQAAYVGDAEIKKVVNFIKEVGGEPDYNEQVVERQKVHGIAGVGLDNGDDDELLAEAKEIVINMGKASASLLQRRLRIGYARAARLLDLLEELGVIGPGQGAKPREVLISQEQYDKMINQGVSGVNLHNQEEAEAPEEYLEDKDEEGYDIPKSGDKTSSDEEAEEEDSEYKEEDEKNKDDDNDEEEDEGKYFAK